MKCGKITGVDGTAGEFLKKECDCIADWLVKIFKVCMGHGDTLRNSVMHV